MNRRTTPATVIDFDDARRKRVCARLTSNAGPPPSSTWADIENAVLVTLVNGMVIATPADELSLDGITLRTSGAMARSLYLPGQFITADDPPHIDLVMDLPLPHGNCEVTARCRLIHFDMVSPEEAVFTLRFLNFTGDGEAIVQYFARARRGSGKHNVHLEADIIEFPGKQGTSNG